MTDLSQSGESYSAMDELRRGLAHVGEGAVAGHELNASSSSTVEQVSVLSDGPKPQVSTRIPRSAALARVDALMSQFTTEAHVPSSQVRTTESPQAHDAAVRQGHVQPSGPLNQVGNGDAEHTISTWVEDLSSTAVAPVVVFSNGTRISLQFGETVVVGRGSGDGRVVLDHKELSRNHFSLAGAQEAVTIVDLGSTNGTEVASGGKIASLVPKAAYAIGRGTRVIVADIIICEIA